MMRSVSTGSARFRIYSGEPQPAVAVLEDVRLLSRIARNAMVDDGGVDTSALGEDVVQLFTASEDWTTAVRARPESAVGAAAGTTLALTALANRETVAALLRGRVAQSTSYTAQTPQLQTLIAAALGRRRQIRRAP